MPTAPRTPAEHHYDLAESGLADLGQVGIFGAGLLVWVFTMTGHIRRNQGLTIGLLVLTYAMPLMGKFFSALIKGSGRRAPFWVLQEPA
jgi:hypothetical protein